MYLHEDEKQIKSGSVWYELNGREMSGTLTLTNHRLFFKEQSTFFGKGSIQFDFEISQLIRCASSPGFLSSKIVVYDIYGNSYVFNVVLGKKGWINAIQQAITSSRMEASKLDMSVKNAILQQSSGPQVQQQVQLKQEDNLDKIRKLKQLLDDGIISEAEFNESKRKLLDGVADSASAVDASADLAAVSNDLDQENKFDVYLVDYGKDKTTVTKVLKEGLGCDLATAKAIVDEVPQWIWEADTMEEALQIKEDLESVGAVVEILKNS